jgi:hypothetical protein
MAFRDFTYPNVLGKLGLTAQEADLSAGATPLAVRPEFAEAFEEGLAIAVGDLGIGTEKAKSEFLIAPLLVELRRATGRRLFSVFSGMELNVNKARGLNGACDYVLTKGGNQHLREAPILGILEAKNEDFSQQGMGQCVAGMFAALCRNRRDGWPVPHVFGAVTTGRAWQFLRLEGSVVTIDPTNYPVRDLGRVMGILHQQIACASATSPGARPRSPSGDSPPTTVLHDHDPREQDAVVGP